MGLNSMGNLDKIIVKQKTGNEDIIFNNNSVGWKLLDFWKWSMSDLLSNTIRGTFAEFIVATAIDIDLSGVREEWDAYDLITKDGIKVEVKTSAYLQTWIQKKYSDILFSIKPAYSWNAETNETQKIKSRPSDVYVFCLLKHKDKLTVNPLDMNQWAFYVMSTKKINEYFGKKNTITIKTLENKTKDIEYSELKNKIYKEYNENKK